MKKIRLGRTNLMITKTGFGALPIQRVSFEESYRILRKAYDSGINFFDTANMYTDSEEKIGHALSDVRENIVIATKSALLDSKGIITNIETSLKRMKTDYIDIFQLHNPSELPSEEIFEVLLQQKEIGRIRHIGITNHRINLAFEAIKSGLFETMQFPFSLLSGQKEIDLVTECQRTDTGFIAMKAMSGGLISSSRASFGFMSLYENVVPIYGIQKMNELEEFIELERNPPQYDEELKSLIEKSKEGLAGDFCRSCGYCLPCPSEIDIPQCARISLLMTRAPHKPFLSPEWKTKMEQINSCINCGNCKKRCPYSLDIPNLLKRELDRYKELYEKLS